MTSTRASDATFLFAVPSFSRGMSRALDIGSTMNVYNESANANAADVRALSDDWRQVGADLYEAIEEHGRT